MCDISGDKPALRSSFSLKMAVLCVKLASAPRNRTFV
jgi:hypothetical protein